MSIEVLGAGKATLDMLALGARASDIRPIAEPIRTVVRKSSESTFDQKPNWPPLSQDTIERKQRQGIDVRAERGKTGALYRSLTAPRARGQIDRREADVLRFGSKIWYAGFQQGTIFQPRRDLIQLSWIERQIIDRIISRWVSKGGMLP
jgi:hypothetical protein